MKSYYLIDNDPMGHKCEILREVRYRAESRGDLWGEIVLKVDGKSEEIVIEVTRCENPGGKQSLPYIWNKKGFTSYVLPHWWSVEVSATDTDGNSRHAYNPQTMKKDGRNVVNFEFLMAATSANLCIIFDEIIKRAFA